MVRLNLKLFLVHQNTLSCFNSKMVRLNYAKEGDKILDTHGFQFQNGTIKFGMQDTFCLFPNQFQFQNGTIKLNIISALLDILVLFQFQNGTIKLNVDL